MELIKKYIKKYQIYYTEKDRIEKQIERLNRKLKRLESKYPYWIEEIVKPIAEKLVKKMSDRYYDILGPFGLTCETSIHFYKKSDKENVKSITFRPGNLDNGEIKIVDNTVNTHRYKCGTIGEINRMNYSTILMTKTINELLKYVS